MSINYILHLIKGHLVQEGTQLGFNAHKFNTAMETQGWKWQHNFSSAAATLTEERQQTTQADCNTPFGTCCVRLRYLVCTPGPRECNYNLLFDHHLPITRGLQWQVVMVVTTVERLCVATMVGVTRQPNHHAMSGYDQLLFFTVQPEDVRERYRWCSRKMCRHANRRFNLKKLKMAQ